MNSIADKKPVQGKASRYSSLSSQEGIKIEARPSYLAAYSNPAENNYYYKYFIKIENEGDLPIQLVSRHWLIINSEGESEEVRGRGVIGKTPIIEPGKSFEYSSFCPLDTDWGTMEGEYVFHRLNDSGEIAEVLEVNIERFYLTSSS